LLDFTLGDPGGEKGTKKGSIWKNLSAFQTLPGLQKGDESMLGRKKPFGGRNRRWSRGKKPGKAQWKQGLTSNVKLYGKGPAKGF